MLSKTKKTKKKRKPQEFRPGDLAKILCHSCTVVDWEDNETNIFGEKMDNNFCVDESFSPVLVLESGKDKNGSPCYNVLLNNNKTKWMRFHELMLIKPKRKRKKRI